MTYSYYNIEQYIHANCMQMEFSIGKYLHAETKGKMCDGCPKYNNGKCESLQKLQAANTKTMPKPLYEETVREEAIRREIGIKEVRRQRKASIYNN